MKTFLSIISTGGLLLSTSVWSSDISECVLLRSKDSDGPGPSQRIASAPLKEIKGYTTESYYRAEIKTPEVSAWFETTNDKEHGSDEIWTTVNYEINTTNPKATTGGLFYLQGDAKFSSTRPYFIIKDSKGEKIRYFFSCIM